MGFDRTFLRLYLVALALVVGARLLLGAGVWILLEGQRAGPPGHVLSLAGLELALWRGSCTLKGLKVSDRERPGAPALLEAERIEVRLRMDSLLSRSPSCEAYLVRPHVRWRGSWRDRGGYPADLSTETPTAAGELETLGATLSGLAPLPLQRVVLDDGRLTFDRLAAGPALMDVEGQLLWPARGPLGMGAEGPTADLWLSARTACGGRLRAFVRRCDVDPRLEVDLLLEDVDLVGLRPLLLRSLDLDVLQGRLDLGLELEAHGSSTWGSLRSVVKDLRLGGPRGHELEASQILPDLRRTLRGHPARIRENPARRTHAVSLGFEGEPAVALRALLEQALGEGRGPYPLSSTRPEIIGG